jgi:signal transduction histidine kinase
MYELNLYALLPLIAMVGAAVLNVFAWLKRAENYANRLLARLATLGVLWFLFVSLSWLTTDASHAALWCKLAYAPAILIPSLMLHLALVLTQGDWLCQHPNRQYWLYLPVPFLGVALTANLLIVGARRFTYGYSFEYGPLHPLYALVYLGFETATFVICVARFRDTQPGELLHHQLKYALWGLALPGIIGIVTFGILPIFFDIRVFPFASFSSIVTMLLMGYAILKRHLFDIVPIALRDVVTSMADGVLLLDREQRIVSINLACQRLFALEPSVVGMHLIEALGTAGERLAASLQVADSAEQRVELILDEPFVALEVSVFPVIRNGGESIGQSLILHDVSARKELDRLREDLSHMLVHDLCNPLSTISGAAKMLEEEAEVCDPVIVRQTVGIILRSVQRMMTLVDNYLEVGRLETRQMPVQRAPVAPDQVVTEAMDTMHALAAAKEITLAAEIGPDIPVAAIDDALIVRVLINLLDNAIKFSPQGGQVKVGLMQEDGRLLFSVSDRGPGISPQEQERVFYKYVQLAQPRRRGLGLGLAFCKLAVEAHGGCIWVESKMGHSTTFYFTLPIVAAVWRSTPPHDAVASTERRLGDCASGD